MKNEWLDRRELQAPSKRNKGGQPGNRNALKTGRLMAEMKALRRMVGKRLKSARALLARLT